MLQVFQFAEDMLAPLIARIEALEKMRGASKQAAAEKDGGMKQVEVLFLDDLFKPVAGRPLLPNLVCR